MEEHDHHHDHHHHHEAGEAHAHDRSHGMTIGLWVWGGIMAFLSVEKMVRLLKGGHGHSHGTAKPKKAVDDEPKKAANDEAESKVDKDKKDLKKTAAKLSAAAKPLEEVEIAGNLNLAADFAHVFTDGLAIGASYLAGNSIVIITTITNLLHELSQEIGDFGVLIKSDCLRRKKLYSSNLSSLPNINISLKMNLGLLRLFLLF